MYNNLDLISEAAKIFGAQCIVASIDCRKVGEAYHCYSNCGTIDIGQDVVEWAPKVEKAGAGEILLTSIELDGTMQGYDVELTKLVADSVSIPVIASGGAGNYEHMYRAISEGHASAVAAASIFHFTEQTPKDAKQYLHEKGIETRII
jgi:cyclase